MVAPLEKYIKFGLNIDFYTNLKATLLTENINFGFFLTTHIIIFLYLELSIKLTKVCKFRKITVSVQILFC